MHGSLVRKKAFLRQVLVGRTYVVARAQQRVGRITRRGKTHIALSLGLNGVGKGEAPSRELMGKTADEKPGWVVDPGVKSHCAPWGKKRGRNEESFSMPCASGTSKQVSGIKSKGLETMGILGEAERPYRSPVATFESGV